MPESMSFESWDERFRAGDSLAEALLLQRYVQRLIALARKRLPKKATGKIDADDIVQSVMRSFVQHHRDGRFVFDDWESLWSLLAVITIRKCSHKTAELSAQRRDFRREAAMMDICLLYTSPSPRDATLSRMPSSA